MDFILGNKELLAAFEASASSDRHSHAYIIEGADGSGRLTLARAIAATLTCTSGKACFECPSCKRIMEGIHQDVKEIRPEEGSGVIKIDAIRDMIADAHIKPGECDKKIFIVDGAHKTKTETQNSLLQIFEEPPKNVVIFLLVPNRNLLLSTLKSRAITVKTEKFSDAFIKEELRKRYPEKEGLIDEAALLADGALGVAISFMESEEDRAAVELVKTYFTALRERATYAKLSSILVPGVAKNKALLFSVMSCFSPAIRDILAYSSGYRDKRMFFSDEKLLSSLASRLDKKKLFSAYETVCRIIRDSGKINVPLALANISLTLSDDL